MLFFFDTLLRCSVSLFGNYRLYRGGLRYAKLEKSKNETFILMKILLEKTDDQHPLTIAEIITELAAYDIQAERKSIYTDIELLRQYGLDIETQRSKSVGYYIAERQFELPELKLLIDAVQSSRFITKKKSEELIKKLSSLTSKEQAKTLRRQVYVADRAKSINETAARTQ